MGRRRRKKRAMESESLQGELLSEAISSAPAEPSKAEEPAPPPPAPSVPIDASTESEVPAPVSSEVIVLHEPAAPVEVVVKHEPSAPVEVVVKEENNKVDEDSAAQKEDERGDRMEIDESVNGGEGGVDAIVKSE